MIPKIIKSAIDDDLLHIFVVTNPIFSMLAQLVVQKFGIPKESIEIIYSRKTGASLLGEGTIFSSEKLTDRYLERLFGVSPKGGRYLREIEKRNKEFIIYAAWADLEINRLIASNLCRGHIYLEEGQMAYWNLPPYKYRERSLVSYLWPGNYTRPCSERTDLYRDDASMFFGLLSGAFPSVPAEKRFILGDYEVLKSFYEPKLLGVDTVGLTCAERRVAEDQWERMFASLVEEMPLGGVIKLHPSFETNIEIRSRVLEVFHRVCPDGIEICDSEVILELEMLYQKKFLIGPLTSLSRYADAFGSDFLHVDLY